MKASDWLLKNKIQIVNYDDIDYINDELKLIKKFNNRFIDAKNITKIINDRLKFYFKNIDDSDSNAQTKKIIKFNLISYAQRVKKDIKEE
jgi:hypothetical protein